MNSQRMFFSIKKSFGNFGRMMFICLLILAISTDAFSPRSFLKRSDDNNKEASSVYEAQSQQKAPSAKRLFAPQENLFFQQQPQAKRFELADGYYDFPQQKRFDFLDSFYLPSNGLAYGGLPSKRFDYNSFGYGPRPMAGFL